MQKKIILFLSILFFCANLFSQTRESKFYPEANGTIGNREKVNAISFRTPNTTDHFFDTLTKKFGSPINEEYFLIYKCYNKRWAKGEIIIRVSRSIDTDLDKTKMNTVFIFAETINQLDLLNPKKASYKKILNFFLRLFDTTIKDEKLDNFE